MNPNARVSPFVSDVLQPNMIVMRNVQELNRNRVSFRSGMLQWEPIGVIRIRSQRFTHQIERERT